MNPQEVVTRLMEMRTEVQRTMPHVGCSPLFNAETDPFSPFCNCYKRDLLRALLAAESDVRVALGLEPF